jgi:hypothetical protein
LPCPKLSSVAPSTYEDRGARKEQPVTSRMHTVLTNTHWHCTPRASSQLVACLRCSSLY